MIPDGWKSITIGDLTSSHSYGPRFNAKNYDENGNVKTIRNTDVTAEGEILYAQAPIASLEPEIIEQHALKTGDLIVITTADCGLSAIFKGQDIPYIPSAYAVRYRLNQNVLPLFIKYFMHTKLAQKQVAQFVRKGTVANLPGSDVLKIKLVLPPLSEQKKIAEILGSVDESIASTQAVIHQTRKVKQGLLQQLLTKGIGHTKFKESAIGKIPKSWEVASLARVCKKITDGSHQPVKTSENGEIPFLYVSCVRDGKILWENAARISEEIYNEIAKGREPQPGVILYTAVGSYGHAALVRNTERFTFQRHIAYILPNPELVYPEFIAIFLNSTQGRSYADLVAVGNAQKTVTLKALSQFPLPTPGLSEQKKIIEIINSYDDAIFISEQRLESLFRLKNGLMQDLLTGKVRVKQTSLT